MGITKPANKIDETINEGSSISQKYHAVKDNITRKPCLIIGLAILFIPIIFCILPHGLGSLVCSTINRTKYFDEEVDIQPMLELEIPVDMDLSQWTNRDADWNWFSGQYGIFRVTSNVQRFSTTEDASIQFRSSIGYLKTTAVVIGEAPNQYLVTKIEEAHETYRQGELYELNTYLPEFCPFENFYRSAAIFQKGNVLIEIYSASTSTSNSGREAEIDRLAKLLSAIVQEGDY